MSLLIDSNVFIWWTTRKYERIAPDILRRIASSSPVYLSMASVWELEIKRNNGRLDLDPAVWARLSEPGFSLLSIELDDVLMATALPAIHRDPFDRMIIAQALRRDLVLVSSDALFAEYGVILLKV